MEHDHLNKLSITFQQKDQCEIWWKLAKWFLKNHDFIHLTAQWQGNIINTRIPRKASSHLLGQKSQEPQSERGY